MVATGDLAQARRLERGLVRVRWFGVVLGLYLVTQTNAGPPPHASHRVILTAFLLVIALGAGNLVIWQWASRARDARSLRRVGLSAFVFDTLIVLGLAWIYSYDAHGFAWVVIYILPLEGAIRYQMRGALWSVAVALANEIAREAYLASLFNGYDFLVANVALRVGIDAIIGLVAGYMAKSLAREAQRAAEQAIRFQEAARREAAARKEVAAFNTAILTGVAAEDLDMSLQRMAATIGRDLGFETLTIMLREGDELEVRGTYGMPSRFLGSRVPLGHGVTGTVAATQKALVVPDVDHFEGYIMTDPRVRSEMAAPLRIGDEVIGVLDVQGRDEASFDQASIELLNRLGDQIALVVHSNRLLSQQRETVERLRELDEMKSDFIAITSHELRTPLTTIRGYVQTLIRKRERIPDEQVTLFMQIIDRQTQRLARLVDDLLLVSRIEGGTVRLERSTTQLNRFLQDTLESLGPERRSRVRLETPERDESVVIDPGRVEQILRNLVENALKFSPPESEVVVTGAVGNRWIDLAVADQGVGIAPEDLPRVFDRFHQAGDVLTRETEGAGLGLYITKRLTEAMGGTIEATSAPGRGSTFRVRLPATLSQADAQGDGSTAEATRKAANASPSPAT